MSYLQRKLNNEQPARPAEPPPQPAQPSAPAQAAPAAPTPGNYFTGKHRQTSSKVAYLRKRLRPKLLKTPDEADQWGRNEPDKIALISERLKTMIDKLGQENPDIRVNKIEFDELRDALLDDLLGFGAIDPLVRDRGCSEIMVNGPHLIFGEFKGKLTETDLEFDDEDHVMWTAQRIVRPLGRRLDRVQPMVDARLPDGSRVHIITEPSALLGTTITIRKFPEKRLTMDDLISFGSLTPEAAEFLKACVQSRLNIVVSGGTGSGKTTLLNVLSGYILETERIVTIEDAAELQLSQRHVVRLETAPPMPGGDGVAGALAIRDLVRGSLRMRPDRIVVGECRGGEALDMLQAMNTGHDGSLTTIHSNNPRDCVARLETLVLMAGMDLPVSVIRRQIVSAVDLIIQISHLRDGSRKLTQVTEIQGLEGDSVTLQDIFVYKLPGQTGSAPATVGGGKLEPTGFRPKLIDRLEENGFKLSGRVFGAGQNRFGAS
ncbi:MAG TPA: CpaF family protein [Phototrophicaceae bacterium]|nr:CpaF family protein [Phototrophicaceae bacterium]